MTGIARAIQDIRMRQDTRISINRGSHQVDHDLSWALAQIEALQEAVSYKPIRLAPRDGTPLILLVDYSADDGNGHPLEDAKLARTIGWNNFDNDGEDVWVMAGWCWDHDHFTEGHGKPVKFILLPAAEVPQQSGDRT
jgi:hypothetical protein